MDYKVVKDPELNDYWAVHESKTNTIISYSKNKDDMKAAARRFNFGAAFAGWTPNFFNKTRKRARLLSSVL